MVKGFSMKPQPRPSAVARTLASAKPLMTTTGKARPPLAELGKHVAAHDPRHAPVEDHARDERTLGAVEHQEGLGAAPCLVRTRAYSKQSHFPQAT
jgi:hypothetical protein